MYNPIKYVGDSYIHNAAYTLQWQYCYLVLSEYTKVNKCVLDKKPNGCQQDDDKQPYNIDITLLFLRYKHNLTINVIASRSCR